MTDGPEDRSIDELQKRRFDKISKDIAEHLVAMRRHNSGIWEAATELHILFTAFLDNYERALGSSAETTRIREEADRMLATFNEDHEPFLEALALNYDENAEALAKLSGAVRVRSGKPK